MHSSVTLIVHPAQPAYENARRHSGDVIHTKKETFLSFGKVLERLNFHGLKIYNRKSNN